MYLNVKNKQHRCSADQDAVCISRTPKISLLLAFSGTSKQQIAIVDVCTSLFCCSLVPRKMSLLVVGRTSLVCQLLRHAVDREKPSVKAIPLMRLWQHPRSLNLLSLSYYISSGTSATSATSIFVMCNGTPAASAAFAVPSGTSTAYLPLQPVLLLQTLSDSYGGLRHCGHKLAPCPSATHIMHT
eukprot:1151673-Pelagomonas_calceolata.AAC.4